MQQVSSRVTLDPEAGEWLGPRTPEGEQQEEGDMAVLEELKQGDPDRYKQGMKADAARPERTECRSCLLAEGRSGAADQTEQKLRATLQVAKKK